ncbi:MAG: tetratricopeptide repeat protein, partial [Rickettsiales bacterium]
MDDPRHALARSALQQGRFDEAEKLYTEIVSDTPADTEALYYLAAMQLRLGDTAAALQSIERAIDLTPKDARFHVARGQVLAQMEAPETAQDAFELALSIEPTNGDAFTSLGTLLFDEGRYEEAEFALRKALIYHPGHRAAATQLGRTLLRLYRIEEAVSLFHAILQIDPNDANVQVNVGIGCTLLGDLASAREAFEA